MAAEGTAFPLYKIKNFVAYFCGSLTNQPTKPRAMSDKSKKKSAKSASGARKPPRTQAKGALSDDELSKATGGTIFSPNVDTTSPVVVRKTTKKVSCFPYCQD